jgi:predicted RNA binding protein YcfA (HicA-like mRNA interferase family)
MPQLRPIKRRELISFLRQLGFQGPFAGAKHQFMQRGSATVRLPNPHQTDISTGLLARILREAGIERVDWETLR